MLHRANVLLASLVALAVPHADASTHQTLRKQAPRALDASTGAPVFVRASFAIASVEERPTLDVTRVTQARAVDVSEVARPARAPSAHESTCAPRWRPDVHADLDRCIDGDGDGCVVIGGMYETGCDAFSAVKWYRRGCRLGSDGACDALGRVGESVPPPPN